MQTKKITKIYAEDTVHLYRLTNMEHSSKRYGRCEVCGEFVSEVHLQTHYTEIMIGGRADWRHDPDGQKYGHEECLMKDRVEAKKTVELESLTLGNNTWVVGHIAGRRY